MILKKRKDNEVTEMNGYVISADGKKMLYVKGPMCGQLVTPVKNQNRAKAC